MQHSLVINVPCKINLHLSVGPRREDGYHALKSIFLALDWGDRLCLEMKGPEGFWELSCDLLPDTEENLVTKAVQLFRERSGDMRGLSCRLEKRVPTGSGLGAGSSDAAMTLIALNRLLSNPLSREDLLSLALRLGSDVPFFIDAGCAWVEGRGEILKALPLPKELYFVLVIPPIHSNTKEAFDALDRQRLEGLLFKESPPFEALLAALDHDPAQWPYYNDFLPALMGRDDVEAREYSRLIDSLRAAGASYCGLSGSGSACFGVFRSSERAVEATFILKKHWKEVHLANPLACLANAVVQ